MIPNPTIILYIAKTLKLPFFKYSNKNFMTIIPTIKLAKMPTKNGILNSKVGNFKTVAANTIGVDNIKEYFATDSLSIPINLPVVIVIPDLETPGIKAKH